jgi:hypothetical protein
LSIVRRGLGDFLHAPALRPKPKPAKPKPFFMYDSVNLSGIPRGATAVAGYVGGNWATYSAIPKFFPKARRLSIAVNAGEDADCLDIERGDATIQQAPAWVKRQRSRGVKRPVVYTSLANARALLAELKAAGIRRKDVRLWIAHYTGRPHRCSPLCHFGFWTRADATQWVSMQHYDCSLCAPDFL